MILPMQVEIRFRPSGRSVCVAPGTTLLEAAREAGLPAARACGGEVLCGRCTCTVSADAPAESADESRAKMRNRVDPGMRLACAVRVERDLEASAPGW